MAYDNSEQYIEGAAESRSLRVAINEIISTLIRVPQWGTLAWNDVKLRYRRTSLGPLWITLGLGATVFSVGILYGALFGNDLSKYLPYFAAGLIAWTVIGSSLGEGCMAFLGAAAIIRAIPVAPAVHVLRLMARQIIMLCHNLLLMIILWIMFPWSLSWANLLVLPGIAINSIALFGAVLALSILGARFRDIQLLVTTFLQLAFLITPVMWDAHSLKGDALVYVANFNPFFHLIEIVRRPMLGELAAPMSWGYAGLTAALALLAGGFFYARYRHRVAFWI